MEKEYNTPQEEASYYKEAYEQEKARSASLAGRLADARNGRSGNDKGNT